MSEYIVSTKNFPIVQNARVYDLDECLIAAGYPMRIQSPNMNELTGFQQKDLDRGKRLSAATLSGNQAHDQFLTGIRVNFDLRASNKMWVEAERYRFLEFVSSQSTMHKVVNFSIENQCNEYVDKDIIKIIEGKIDYYKGLTREKERLARLEKVGTSIYNDMVDNCKEAYLQILYSLPSGFTLTARMTTNYRCLKNIYKQRHDHRLPEWRLFCDWIATLPYANELILCKANKDDIDN